MFFEPSLIPDSFLPFVPVGFTELPGGSNYPHLQVMNDHSYGPCALGDLNSTIYPVCKAYHEVKVGTRRRDADKFNVPLIISEFGACLGGETCVAEIQGLTEACDDSLAGWAYWQFKKYGDLTTTAMTGNEGFYNEDGSLQQDKVKALTRTYLQNTQGELLSLSFNSTTALFNASFQVDTSIAAPTVLYYSTEYWYSDGSVLEVETAAGQALTRNDYELRFPSENHLTVQVVNPAFNGQVVVVRLAPTSAAAF